MEHSPDSSRLVLRPNEERRIRNGHAWVYSNEVDIAKTPLKDLLPGAAVDIYSHRGRWLGGGYVNPATLIAARIVSRDRDHPLGPGLFVHRLKVALSLREKLYTEPFYRLVHGEGDGLPGLVIDRFGEVCVVQIATAGMETRRDDVLRAVEKVLRPQGVVLRCDVGLRKLEGLDLYVETRGSVAEDLLVQENTASFRVPVRSQKTGWYFDQRDNRARFAPLASGGKVLDVCAYAGAWGIQAALHGATEVLCVDSSADALKWAARNAGDNQVEGTVTTRRGDANRVMEALTAEGRRFDTVVLDPPAYIKRRKDVAAGIKAYARLNEAALKLIGKDGFLITCSCSHHLALDRFLDTVHQAARRTERALQLIAEGGQAPDHPIHPAMPETRYLKCLVFRVLPRS